MSRRDRELAQDFVYDAWESDDPEERAALARTALSISPDVPDAYLILAEGVDDPEERIGIYRDAVASGERAIGKRAFKEDAGHFWGIFETRPYMRARASLAEELWDQGALEEAVEHWWDLLRLNPNDNQGIRYILLARLLEDGRDDDAERLLAKYEDEFSVWWAYGRLLLALRRGEHDDVGPIVGDAFAMNPFVPEYLLGRKPLPEESPEYLEVGGETEAQGYVEVSGQAWRASPDALERLTSLIAEADRALGDL